MPKILVCAAIVFFITLRLVAAGSGSLWYRCTTLPTNLQCATDTDLLPALYVDTGGPVTLTITSQSGGTMNLSVIDACGSEVYAKSLSFVSGAVTSQSITFTVPTSGVYRLKPGGDIWLGRFRFAATTAKFVMPQGIDWDPYPDAVATSSGSYYFYVPSGTDAFTFRIHAGFPLGGPEWGAADVVDQNGILQLSIPAGQGYKSFPISVPPGSAGGFWRVDLKHCGDLRFYVIGIPAFFAETPDAWFQPPVSVAPSSGNVGDLVVANTAVFCPDLAAEFVSPNGGAVLATAEVASRECRRLTFKVPNLAPGGYRLRISGCGLTETAMFTIGSQIPALHPVALGFLVVLLTIVGSVALRRYRPT